MLRDAGLDAVIGMYPAVHRLRTTVVAPWGVFSLGDTMVRPPRRVLLYGAPGSGVTFIARRLVDELATVADVGATVVESLDALAADPDEVAALVHSPEFRDVVLIGVSHAPWDLPSALLGDDGFERLTFVSPPDWDARRFRLWETSWGRSLPTTDLDQLVAATEGWSGVDLVALGDAVDTADAGALRDAATSRTPATAEWLASARTMIRSLGSYGRVDDLVGYLQRYRLL